MRGKQPKAKSSKRMGNCCFCCAVKGSKIWHNMKQLFCLLLAAWVSVCLAPLSAQTSFGLHGGLNYGKTHYDKFSQFEGDNALGYFFGTTVRHQLQGRFALGLDAQFALKASTSTIVLGQNEFQSRYLEAAPRVEYFFTKNIGVSLGFYAAYLLDQRAKLGNGSWVRTDEIYDIQSFDAGLATGLSLKFGRVFGFLRYTHGLVATNKFDFLDDSGQSLDTARLFNRYFQAGIGYMIFE